MITFETDKIKLKYLFIGSKISIQILKMDERFRNHCGGIEYIAKNGVIIYSFSLPSIFSDGKKTVLTLRGHLRKYDMNPVLIDNYNGLIQLIEEALIDWSNNWDGWEKVKINKP